MPEQDFAVIDELLRRAAASIVYPPTPDLAAAWESGPIPAPAFRRAERPSRMPRLAAAFTGAVVVLVLAAVLAQRSVRDAVADFLGLAVEGEKIVRVTPVPGETPTPFPSPVALEQIATPISSADAARILTPEQKLPPGEPVAIFRINYNEHDALVFRYDGYDLWQIVLGEDGFLKKYMDGAIVEQVMVGPNPGYWLSGGMRLVTYIDASGTEAAGSARSVEGNTLLWSDDGVYYRIEGDLRLEEALAIADSMQ